MKTEFNLCCTVCGRDDLLDIKVTTWLSLSREDNEAYLTVNTVNILNHENEVFCGKCGNTGPVQNFRPFRYKPTSGSTAASKTLPPDPEQKNDKRAEWAASSIRHFQCHTGTDWEDAVSDLLCDVMHLCDREGFAFEKELERGRMHYEAETTDPE